MLPSLLLRTAKGIWSSTMPRMLSGPSSKCVWHAMVRRAVSRPTLIRALSPRRRFQTVAFPSYCTLQTHCNSNLKSHPMHAVAARSCFRLMVERSGCWTEQQVMCLSLRRLLGTACRTGRMQRSPTVLHCVWMIVDDLW